MNIAEQTPSRLVIEEQAWKLGTFITVCALMLGYKGYESWLYHRAFVEDVVGPICGTIMLLGAGWTLTFYSRFEFDKVRGQLRWQKRRLLMNRGGTVPFSEIGQVKVEVMEREKYLLTRPTIALKNGEEIPMQLGFAQRSGADYVLAQTILRFLGRNEEAEAMQKNASQPFISSMTSGNKIEAIKLMRLSSGMSLKDAKKKVEALMSEMEKQGATTVTETDGTTIITTISTTINGEPVSPDDARRMLLKALQEHGEQKDTA